MKNLPTLGCCKTKSMPPVVSHCTSLISCVFDSSFIFPTLRSISPLWEGEGVDKYAECRAAPPWRHPSPLTAPKMLRPEICQVLGWLFGDANKINRKQIGKNSRLPLGPSTLQLSNQEWETQNLSVIHHPRSGICRNLSVVDLKRS